MAMTLVGSATASNNTGSTISSISCSSTISVNSGDLVVLWVKHEGASTTLTGTDSTDTETMSAPAVSSIQDGASGDLHTGFRYKTAATVTGSVTYKMTFGAARAYVELVAYVFRPDGGETVSYLTDNGASGSSTTPNSGNISPTITDGVVLGGFGNYTSSSPSAVTINGVSAEGSTTATYAMAWYDILTTGFAGGAAAGTGYSSAAWTCGVIAFESAVGGGGGGGDMTITLRNQMKRTYRPRPYAPGRGR